MQHVNVKVFARNAGGVNVSEAIPVFHRWIQQRALPELLIDVADYTHVPAGPGVLLIAHEANYSLDWSGERLGLLYNRKTLADGSAQDVLRQAYGAAIGACRNLEQEPEFRGKLQFSPDELELLFNDRLLHPNTEEGWSAAQPEVARFFDGVFGDGAYTLTHVGEPRERLRVHVRRTH